MRKIQTIKAFKKSFSQFINALIQGQLSEVNWEGLVSIPHLLITLTKGFSHDISSAGHMALTVSWAPG